MTENTPRSDKSVDIIHR